MKNSGDTKAAMAQALYLCMQSTPIDRISIKTITDICGLNRQTFYYHFKDIYDLVRWMYVTHIDGSIDRALAGRTRAEALREALLAVDAESGYYKPIYESRRYYTRLRREIVDFLTTRFRGIFEQDFERLDLDEEYRAFLSEMHALVVFEFVERRMHGNAISSIDGFVDHWLHMVHAQLEGEDSRAEASR